jgi:hypothetical protein
MPRAPRARQVDNAEAIRLFAEHHIVAVRKARRNGEIIAVKHAAWGWMSPRDYYLMQEMHTATVAILPKFFEGGYRAKAALWSMAVDVAGFSIPLGLVFPAIETVGLAEAIGAGNPLDIAFWSYALLGPFGDILAIFGLIKAVAGLDQQISDAAGAARQNSILPPINPPVFQGP